MLCKFSQMLILVNYASSQPPTDSVLRIPTRIFADVRILKEISGGGGEY
jgi:hypothetical protein